MNSARSIGFLEFFEAVVLIDIHEVPIVDARASHGVLIDREAEWPDEMEPRTRGCAGSRHRAGVGGDLGLDQHHVKRVGRRRRP